MRFGKRKRVLIVSCRFDEDRRGGRRPWRVPQAMAPVYVAGGFHSERCEVRVYSELYSGPLDDKRLLAWPEMLVLSGLQVDFDRFLQLTAYARTLNPQVIVVAGGSICEAAPEYCRQFFDYVCPGPVEEIGEVVRAAWGPGFAAEEFRVRHDLAHWCKSIGFVETSRNCNFACSFCSLSINRRAYAAMDRARLEREMADAGTPHFFFLDNNFYGNNQQQFDAKLAFLKQLKDEGRLRSWSAEVTSDFFFRDRNLESAREAGCCALFCGVESFDSETLLSYDKRQNVVQDQIDLIRKCLDAGILFLYGLIFDPSRRSLESIAGEIDFVIGNDELPLASYFTLPIPLLGTPFFFEQHRRGALLPQTGLRDLDAYTLTLRPLEGLDDFSERWPDLVRLKGRKWKVIRHELRFQRRYRRLSRWQRIVSWGNMATFLRPKYRNAARTFISTTEILDPQYTPAFPLDGRYEAYFRPTPLTNERGELDPRWEEVFQRPAARSRAAADSEQAAAPTSSTGPV